MLICLIVHPASSFASNIVFSTKLYNRIEQQYSESAIARILAWQEIIEKNVTSDDFEKLYIVNNFFNKVDFKDDIEHWGERDYWATPVEFLATNAGDCEDFTIAKFYSLLALGIDKEKLRLMYVTLSQPTSAHMVLAYYKNPDSIPLILDNINKRILLATQRRDLTPIYSFNGRGLWLASSFGRGRKMKDDSNNQMWRDLSLRMEDLFGN